MLAKAQGLGADALIADLEDGVAPALKAAARSNARAALEQPIPWMLRINALGSAWDRQDLELALATRPAAIVLPKAESPLEVAELGTSLGATSIGIALMVETARGVACARELAGSHPRVGMLIVGSADLRMSLGARPDEQRAWELHALGAILLAARMHGCAAIDSVYFHFRDPTGLARHARIARDLGYDGKSCIHPDQIEPIHGVWRSSPEEVAWARKVLQAWSTRDLTAGVVTVDDEMVEELHVRLADRILERAVSGPRGS